ncbi:hypothetical protein [Sphingomonas sp. S2-65]|uniref:hypothetical protein n=1 Tax=Sphingomonas sp. S2-65 TaxID=2903960 RepID=UPI001F3F21EA|nr:hypothetical protein [Sphingomonas sp. S2-65]UYY57771.1 hypothetical protein LZ586_14040 [Sphingomonas sp. S2-65]
MTAIATIALGLSIFAAAPVGAATHTHTLVVDHPSGPVDARYRGRVIVEHQQIGSVAPPGRGATLRCAWTARLAVDRTATTPSKAAASRSFVTDGIMRGSRPGWCSAARSAIAGEVASRLSNADVHLAAAARADHPVLLAEIDRLAGPA